MKNQPLTLRTPPDLADFLKVVASATGLTPEQVALAVIQRAMEAFREDSGEVAKIHEAHSRLP